MKFTAAACIVSPPNTLCVTTLPCKVLMTNLEIRECTISRISRFVIKTSQGSVVTQTVLGGLTIHAAAVNFILLAMLFFSGIISPGPYFGLFGRGST